MIRSAAKRYVATSVLVAVLVSLPALTFPSAAGAYLYWGSFQTNSIGRADLNGSHANQWFVLIPGAPNGLAVTRSYIYWTDFASGTIGRANLDGTNGTDSLVVGAQLPDGLTVSGNYIYWSDFGLNSVGRANLDGTHVNQRFVAGSSPVGGVAVSGGYIYWTNFRADTIGRANLDGSQPNFQFITGASSPNGLAISGNTIYWSNYLTGTIGRANLDGSGPDQQFITGAHAPDGLAIQGGFIYWANTQSNSIGRANLDGSGVNQAFFRTPTRDIQAVAAGDDPPSPPRLGNVKQSAARWRAGGALPHYATARPPVGTTFSFTLDRPAQVRFVFVQGSRIAGTLSHACHRGRNKLFFQGRINRRKSLRPGPYTVRITATAAGRSSQTARLRFTIVRG